MERFLNDSFSKKGSDYNEFKKICRKMSEQTHILRCTTGETEFISHCSIEEQQKDGRTPFFVLREEYIDKFLKFGRLTTVGTIKNTEFYPELLEELINTTGLIMNQNGFKYLISDLSLFTLLKQCSLGGTEGRKKSSLIRNMHIAEAAYDKNILTSFVYREELNAEGMPIRKIFGALGGYYHYIPQDIIVDVIDKMMAKNEITVNSWEVNHEFTEIRVSFKEYGFKIGEREFYPGILIKTSDIGASMLYVRLVLNTSDDYVVLDEVCYKHNSNSTTAEDLLKDVEEFIPNMKDFREKIQLLAGKTIDVSKNKNNYTVVTGIVKYLAEKRIKKELSKKRYDNVISCITDDILSTKQYNFAEICAIFFAIPEKEASKLNEVPLLELRKNIGTLPYVLSDEKVMNYLKDNFM